MALNKEQAIAKARLDERIRAMRIVDKIFGNNPEGTLSHYKCVVAINEIKGEDNE